MTHGRARDISPGVQPVSPDGRLVCLECGSTYKSLPHHLRLTEHLSSAEYRARHGLRATVPLDVAGLRRMWSDQGPGEGVPPRRPATRRVASAANRAAAARAGAESHARRRAALETLAAEHGYRSWRELIEATARLSTTVVGRQVGRSAGAIGYWRKQIIGADWVSYHGRLQPRRAAAYARLDAVFAERGWKAGLPDALAAIDGGLAGVARDIHSTPTTLRAWDQHRRGSGSPPHPDEGSSPLTHTLPDNPFTKE